MSERSERTVETSAIGAGSVPDAGEDPGQTTGWRGPRHVGAWAWAAIAGMTTAVIVFSAARGIVRGFQPLGDNALVELRAWDVLTSDRPLLGGWSSASVSVGTDVNHPGPLLFDLMAIPVRLFGGPAGLAIGAAAINIAAVWSAVVTARRVAGDLAATATALATAVLAWSLGSELLYDTWGPNILVLPFFAFLVLVWATALGHGWAFPAAVLAGSLCLHAHLSYLFLVPTLLLAGVGGLVGRDRGDVLTRHGRGLGAGVVVGLVLWAQPLWEQLRGGGDGNLARLLSSSGSQGEDLTGFALAVRMLAEVVAIPPAFARPGYESSIPLTPWVESGPSRSLPADMASFPVALLALVVVGGALALVARAARRRGDATMVVGALVVAVAAVAGLASAAISPIDSLGLSPHKVRWMWSLAAFTLALLLAGVGTMVVAAGSRRLLAGLVVAVAALVSVLTLPAYVPRGGGPVEQQSAFPIVESLREQVGRADLDGTVLVDASGLFFAEPYAFPVMAELARDGVSFVVASGSWSRQVGPTRLAESADVGLTLAYGADADVTPPGATRIAHDPGDDRWPAIAVFVEPLERPDG